MLVRLASFGFLNSAQLEKFLLDGSELTTRSRAVTIYQILHRLRKRGLIAATPALVGGPSGGSARLAYYLTSAGQRFVDTLEGGARPCRPQRGTLFVGHALMAAEVALAFHGAARSHEGHELRTWESEWEAAELLRSSKVIPDARLVYRTRSWELEAFVEIDTGTERTTRFVQKIREYVRAWRDGGWRGRLASWPLVLTVTVTTRRASILRQATENLLRSQRDAARLARATEFDFAALPDVGGARGPLGEIWQVALRDGMHALVPAERSGPPDMVREAKSSGANGPRGSGSDA